MVSCPLVVESYLNFGCEDLTFNGGICLLVDGVLFFDGTVLPLVVGSYLLMEGFILW